MQPHTDRDALCCITTPAPHWDAILLSQNPNGAYIIPQLIWIQSYMEEKRKEDKREEVMGAEGGIEEEVKGKEEMRWKLVAFGVLLKHCATSSPTATSSLQLFQFPTIICHLQFPFTFTPSFTPLFSVSHTARHKRQRGGSEGWIKRLISLSPPMHREIERNCDREGSKRGFLFPHLKSTDPACQNWGWLDENSQISGNFFFLSMLWKEPMALSHNLLTPPIG